VFEGPKSTGYRKLKLEENVLLINNIGFRLTTPILETGSTKLHLVNIDKKPLVRNPLTPRSTTLRFDSAEILIEFEGPHIKFSDEKDVFYVDPSNVVYQEGKEYLPILRHIPQPVYNPEEKCIYFRAGNPQLEILLAAYNDHGIVIVAKNAHNTNNENLLYWCPPGHDTFTYHRPDKNVEVGANSFRYQDEESCIFFHSEIFDTVIGLSINGKAASTINTSTLHSEKSKHDLLGHFQSSHLSYAHHGYVRA
jgi:hypothetical protein